MISVDGKTIKNTSGDLPDLDDLLAHLMRNVSRHKRALVRQRFEQYPYVDDLAPIVSAVAKQTGQPESAVWRRIEVLSTPKRNEKRARLEEDEEEVFSDESSSSSSFDLASPEPVRAPAPTGDVSENVRALAALANVMSEDDPRRAEVIESALAQARPLMRTPPLDSHRYSVSERATLLGLGELDSDQLISLGRIVSRQFALFYGERPKQRSVHDFVTGRDMQINVYTVAQCHEVVDPVLRAVAQVHKH